MAYTTWLASLAIFLVIRRVLSQEYRNYSTVFTQNRIDMSHKMKLLLASSRSHVVNVEVHVPFFPSPVPYKSKTLNPGVRKVISLPANIQMPTGTLTSNRVVRVVADDDITVVALNEEGSNGDIFQVKESGMLGTEYVLPSQEFTTIGSAVTVGIVSPWSNITLHVKLPASITSLQATLGGVTQTLPREFTITLQENHSLQIQSTADLAGTSIRSDKPIAVVFGVNRTASLDNICKDGQLTQLYSTDRFGTKYIVFGYKISNVQDNIHVLSIHPDTRVTFDGSTSVLANAGDSLLLHIGRNQFCLLETSSPTLVVMATRSGVNKVSEGDNSLSSLQPLPLSGLQFTITIPSGNYFTATNLHLVLLIETSAVGEVLLDGVLITGVSWTEVAGTNISSGYFSITDNGKARMVRHRLFLPMALYLHIYTGCNAYSMMFEPYQNEVLYRSSTEDCVDRRSMTIFKGKRMTSQRIKSLSVKSDMNCVRFCMNYRDCVGVNFSTSVTPGNDNCNLLFGETSGETTTTDWTFYKITFAN